MRIVVIGFGTVGQSFCNLLHERRRELIVKYGLNPRVVAISDTGGVAADEVGLDIPKVLELKKARKSVAALEGKGHKEKTGLEAIEENEAEVVVEATPTNIETGEPGISHIEKAFKLKRNVITVNKGPLALAFPALMELARYNGVMLKFSGTVGGGTPILEFGKRCLEADRILAIRGILNGTTNYILTEMDEKGISFNEGLASAQKLGYAEANPSLDVDGLDSAAKCVIMANFLVGIDATIRDVDVKGIRDVTLKDIERAKARGAAVKLVASIDGKLSVAPVELKRNDPMCVGGVLNSVKFISQYAGEEVIVGKGAGGSETASAILRDLLEIRNSILVV
jgi:homoserine dehydrogenase